MKAWACSLALISLLTLKWVTSCVSADVFCADPALCDKNIQNGDIKADSSKQEILDVPQFLDNKQSSPQYRLMLAKGPEYIKNNQVHRFRRNADKNEPMVKKRFYRFGRNMNKASDPEDQDESAHSSDKRQFYRFGRSEMGDVDSMDKRFYRFGRSEMGDGDSTEKRFYRFGRSDAGDGDSMDKRQFYRFGRSEMGDGDSMDKRQFYRFGRDFGDGSKDPEKRFYRFGRAVTNDPKSLEKRQFYRFGRSDTNPSMVKRFLRFGRSASDNDVASQASLQELLGARDVDGSSSRKRRSLHLQGSQPGEKSQQDLLERKRRSSEGEASDGLENSAPKQLAKRDVHGENDSLYSGLRLAKRNLDDLADKRFIRFGKRFMRFGRPGEARNKRFMRFGRSFDDFSDKRFMRFGKRDSGSFIGNLSEFADKRFIRFGKRFDELADKRFMRFGRSTRKEDDGKVLSTQKS